MKFHPYPIRSKRFESEREQRRARWKRHPQQQAIAIAAEIQPPRKPNNKQKIANCIFWIIVLLWIFT